MRQPRGIGPGWWAGRNAPSVREVRPLVPLATAFRPATAWIATLGLAATLAILPGPPAARAAVNLGFAPSDTVVSPGDSLTLALAVSVAGTAFNGFDAVVGYDPAALALLPLSPTSLQQGCLMTGGCSPACGTTFHHFEAAGDSLVCTSILLCDQLSLTGPGPVYRLRFQASLTPQVTVVHLRGASFYDAGLFVGPVITHDAYIMIASPVGVDDRAPAARGLVLRAGPNPTRGVVTLSTGCDADGYQALDVLDVTGRVVRHLGGGWRPAGARTVVWDGTDAAGRGVPAGVYLVRFEAGASALVRRVALLR